MKKTKLSLSIALTALGLALSSTASASYVFVMPNDAMKSSASMEEAITDVKNSANSGADNGTGEPEVPEEEEVATWEEFASKYGFNTAGNFSQFIGGNIAGVTKLPSDAYPNGSIQSVNLSGGMITNIDELFSIYSIGYNGMLNVSNNNISNIDGIKNLGSSDGSINLSNNNISVIDQLSIFLIMGDFDISYNNITEVTGVNNLNSVRDMNLNGNPITKITGFSNLNSADNIYIDSPYLNDISGLGNMRSGTIIFDNPYSGNTLEGTTFCNNVAVKVVDNTSTDAKSTVCGS